MSIFVFIIRLALIAGPLGGNLGALYCTKSYVVRQLFTVT